MRPLPRLPDWVEAEHQVAKLLQQQEEHGWYFNERAAWQLASIIQKEYEEIVEVLQDRHPQVKASEFTPKRNNKTQGYISGATFTKLKQTNFQSRDHIAWILQTHYGWKPSLMTSTGKVVIDETVLKSIGADDTESGKDIALQCLRLMELQKLLGMISEGANAWLKLVTKSSRIHHHCSVGAITHRQTHRHPNLAQVPSDPRCRALFTASPGMVMVGADLAGIELRMLSHYLARWDGGKYADILLNGDIHQVNADKVGVSRSAIKTISYAFLYGASNVRLGLSYDKSLTEDRARTKGKEIREAYVNAIEGLSELLKAAKERAECGFIKAIDGRPITVESPHKALNCILQSSAAVVAKRWMLLSQNRWGKQLAFIHDELQFETDPQYVDDLRFHLELSAAMAGEYYNLRCPISAESKTGSNWSEVH